MISDDQRTRVMLALEHLIGAAARDGDDHLLGICCEAWERFGFTPAWLADIVATGGWLGHDLPTHLWSREDCEIMVHHARYRKNRAKLRRQADALLAALPHIPLEQAEWSRRKFDHLHRPAAS